MIGSDGKSIGSYGPKAESGVRTSTREVSVRTEGKAFRWQTQEQVDEAFRENSCMGGASLESSTHMRELQSSVLPL